MEQDLSEDHIMEAALKRAADAEQWYAGSRKRYMISTWLLRTLAFLFLIVGAWLPLIQHEENFTLVGHTFDSTAQAGFAVLVLASLLMAADRVFLTSENWQRFAIAQQKIVTLRQMAQTLWQKARLDPERTTSVVDLAIKLEKDVRTTVDTETADWAEKILKSGDELKALIDSALNENDGLVREQREQQRLDTSTGALIVRIADEHKLVGDVVLSLDDGEPVTRSAALPSFALTDLAPGQTKLQISGEFEDRTKGRFVRETVALVQVGEVTRVIVD